MSSAEDSNFELEKSSNDFTFADLDGLAPVSDSESDDLDFSLAEGSLESEGDLITDLDSGPAADPALQAQKHFLTGVETPGFRILNLPKNGGMGAVYRAWNLKLERVVALKLSTITDGAGRCNASEDQQLRMEATNLARIEHPAIAGCYGYGRFEGLSYFEMQWVDGVSLDDVVRFVTDSGSRFSIPVERVTQWMRELVDALIYCQLRGVHHLDLKPKNLMLTPRREFAVDGEEVVTAIVNDDHAAITADEFEHWCVNQELRVLDFGLARRSEKSGEFSTTSGSPKWMAPEQVCGFASNPVLIDQYGIGGVVYACLTCNGPNRPDVELFTEARVAQDAKEFCVRDSPRCKNPRVGRDLEAIVLKCLHIDPEQRYDSFDQLRKDLVLSEELRPICAREAPLGERFTKRIRRSPYLFSVILMLAIGLLVTSFLFLSLAKANRKVVAARESDRATFQQAVECLATMDRLYLSDPQLNRPENRDLATRFKATLFELYQVFSDRKGLQLEDRQRLANVSRRLAMEQRQRGDYRLAADFFQATVDQYSSLVNESPSSIGQLTSLCEANIDLLEARSLVSRDVYPAEAILEHSESLIIEARETMPNLLILYTISSHCHLKLILEGRDGARETSELLDECKGLLDRVVPANVAEKAMKARAEMRIALVAYKSGVKWYAERIKSATDLFENLVEENPGDQKFAMEYVAALSFASMPKVTLIKPLPAGKASTRKAEEIARLVSEVDSNYRRATQLIDSAMKADPLNNSYLSRKISIQWMIADFNRARSKVDPDWDLGHERDVREQCMISMREMIKRQPQSHSASQGLALQLYRQSRCFREDGRLDLEIANLKQILLIDNWDQLGRFELSDQLGFVLKLAKAKTDSNPVIECSDENLAAAALRLATSLKARGFTDKLKFKFMPGYPVDRLAKSEIQGLSLGHPGLASALADVVDLIDQSELQ